MVTWKNLDDANFTLLHSTVLMAHSETFVSTVQFSVALLDALNWVVFLPTQDSFSMLTWQWDFNFSVTSTFLATFL